MAGVADAIISRVVSERDFPRNLLNLTLSDLRDNPGEPLSEVIFREIYANIFMKDLTSQSGGEEIWVPLEGLTLEPMNSGYTLLRVPKSLTQEKSIIHPIEITWLPIANHSYYGNNAGMPVDNSIVPMFWQASQNPAINAAANLLSAHDTPAMRSTSRIRLIGENLIRIGDPIYSYQSLRLRCTVAYDPFLGNISPEGVQDIYEAFVLLVKSFIYNHCILTLDSGQLQLGQSLGVVKDIIGGYSDAANAYAEALKEKVRPVLIMADVNRYNTLIVREVGRTV